MAASAAAEDVTTGMGVVDLEDNVAGISEVTISGPALVAFLQALLNDGGLATFILSNDDAVDPGLGLASKEKTPPRRIARS